MPAVYEITNRVNSKRYIGFTGGSVEQRWVKHISAAVSGRDNMLILRAIKKYGKDVFSVYRLCETLDYHYAGEIERALIESLSPEYNIAPGGAGRGEGFKQTEETKAKISAKCKGRPGFWRGKPSPNRKVVICADDEKQFPSIHAAAKFYGLTAIQVSWVCNKQRHTAGRHVFRFAGEEISKSEADDILIAARVAKLSGLCRINAERKAKREAVI